MAEPFPTLIGGFTGGLEKGLQFGQRSKALRQQATQQTFTNNLNLLDRYMKIDPDAAIGFAEKAFKGTEIDFSRYKGKSAEFKTDFQAFKETYDNVLNGNEPEENLVGVIDTIRLKYPLKAKRFEKPFTDIRKGAKPGGDLPSDLQTFETVYGDQIKSGDIRRGSPEYKELFTDYRENLVGRKQVIGADEDGNLITFNPIGGKIETTTVAQPQPKQKGRIPAEQVVAIATIDSLKEGITSIRNLAKANPQAIGPIEGNWTRIKTRFVGDQDATTLLREVESMITLAYALSGKQISEKEMKMLKAAILPTVTQPDVNFAAALDHAERWLTRNRTNRLKTFEEAGFHIGDLLEDKDKTITPTLGQPTPSGDTVIKYDAQGNRIQ